ncbi:phage tail protein [Escherichia coli]|nr:phage tail protein [Escherichia coli]
MATKYLALLTNIGAAKLAKATALGTKVEITQLAVGDGNGVLPTPNPAQTALVHELRRAPLNMLTVDPANASQIIAEQVIPEDVGGWWIREIGLFDKDGDMVAIANCAETYKPQLQEGSGRVQVIRVILIVSSTEAVTLKIDPAVVLATRQYVDSQLRAHEQSRNHPDASTTEKGFVQLSSSVTSDSESQAATSKAVKIAMDNGSARLAKDRNLSDLPNTALARQNLELGDSSTRNVGTTAGTVASGDDARITGAMQKSQNGGDIPDVAKFLQNLGLGETINKASGAMQKSANGADISDVSAFRNALQLGTAATRDVGADNASKLLDLDSFRSMMSGNGYIYIPCIATTGNPVKLMLQWGTVATQKGADAGYALPFAFPYAGLFATGNRGTSGYNAAMNVRIANRTHISIQNWSPSGEGTEDCCFIALGY